MGSAGWLLHPGARCLVVRTMGSRVSPLPGSSALRGKCTGPLQDQVRLSARHASSPGPTSRRARTHPERPGT